MNKKEIKQIKKRIEELKVLRSEMTSYGGRSKYNFAIGELQAIIDEM